MVSGLLRKTTTYSQARMWFKGLTVYLRLFTFCLHVIMRWHDVIPRLPNQSKDTTNESTRRNTGMIDTLQGSTKLDGDGNVDGYGSIGFFVLNPKLLDLAILRKFGF